MEIRDLTREERLAVREKVNVWGCDGQCYEWTDDRPKKWLLTLPIPEIEGIDGIQGISYYAGLNTVPSALYCLDGSLQPILSGSLEILNFWRTPNVDQDPDPENQRWEIEKIIGICGRRIVIQHFWQPVSTAIVEKFELIENAPDLWAYFIQMLRVIVEVFRARGPTWDLFVLEYFLGDEEDVKKPRADKYWIEIERKVEDEVVEPVEVEEEFQILHHYPDLGRLQHELEEAKSQRRAENEEYEMKLEMIQAQLNEEVKRRRNEELADALSDDQ